MTRPRHATISAASARTLSRQLGARARMAWRLDYGCRPDRAALGSRAGRDLWRDAWREVRAEHGPVADPLDCYICFALTFLDQSEPRR